MHSFYLSTHSSALVICPCAHHSKLLHQAFDAFKIFRICINRVLQGLAVHLFFAAREISMTAALELFLDSLTPSLLPLNVQG